MGSNEKIVIGNGHIGKDDSGYKMVSKNMIVERQNENDVGY